MWAVEISTPSGQDVYVTFTTLDDYEQHLKEGYASLMEIIKDDLGVNNDDLGVNDDFIQLYGDAEWSVSDAYQTTEDLIHTAARKSASIVFCFTTFEDYTYTAY